MSIDQDSLCICGHVYRVHGCAFCKSCVDIAFGAFAKNVANDPSKQYKFSFCGIFKLDNLAYVEREAKRRNLV
jgi:hypothetical protein